MKFFKFTLPIIALFLVTACQTSGRTYAEMEAANAFPPIKNNEGRIFLYRYSTLGGLVTPPIRIDGEVVGDSVAEGFFFVDLPSGEHKITAETEVEKSLLLYLNQDETIYVEQTAAIGWLVGRIELDKADPAQAKKKLKDLHYQKDAAQKTTPELKDK